jgi:hypothetical protein
MKNIKLFENYISSDDSNLEGINEEEALFASELVKSLVKGVSKKLIVPDGTFGETWIKWVKYQSDMADLMLAGDIAGDKFKNKISEITNWLKLPGNAQEIRILYGMKEKFQEEKSRFPMTAAMYDIIDKVKIP